MCWSSKQHILQSRLSQGIGNHHRLISTCASTTPQRWHISTTYRGGGTHLPSLSAIALEFWSHVLKIRSWVKATHILGILNVDADMASRQFNPRVEWTLDSQIFQKIVDRFYLPEVDLFASRLTHQVESYVLLWLTQNSLFSVGSVSAMYNLKKSSSIMKGETAFIKQLQKWLGEKCKWNICYRASRDGWSGQDFHKHCDNKGPTVVLVKANDYIFGGYTDQHWESPSM